MEVEPGGSHVDRTRQAAAADSQVGARRAACNAQVKWQRRWQQEEEELNMWCETHGAVIADTGSGLGYSSGSFAAPVYKAAPVGLRVWGAVRVLIRKSTRVI